MKTTKFTYKLPEKEPWRRFNVRLRTLFNIPKYYTCKVNGKAADNDHIELHSIDRIPVKIPNFWYAPFEVYLLAHLKRAYFIMTCDEYSYVDYWTRYLSTSCTKSNSNELGGSIGMMEMCTMPDGSIAVKKANGVIEIIKENETKINPNN